MAPDKWRKVEAKFNTVFLDILREYPDSDTRFHDGGWFQDIFRYISGEALVCTEYL